MNELNLKFLPLAKDIESAIPYDPAGQAISCENSQSLISVSAETPRIMVASNSNMLTLQTELKKTIEDTFILNKYPFNILAEQSEIESFVAGLELTKSDIIVLGGQGNSLLQGMATPKFKKHEPSGKPAAVQGVIWSRANKSFPRSICPVIRHRVSQQVWGLC